MQYKPYPTDSKPVEQERGPAPQTVQRAVKLMYAGAAVSTVALVVTLAFIGGVKDAISKHYPHYTPSHVNQLYTQYIQYVIFTSAFAILLWLVMAWASGKGKAWARVASSVLFGLYTIELFASLRLAGIGVGIIFAILTWLVGLGAIVLLWRPDSNTYFRPQKYLLLQLRNGVNLQAHIRVLTCRGVGVSGASNLSLPSRREPGDGPARAGRRAWSRRERGAGFEDGP